MTSHVLRRMIRRTPVLSRLVRCRPTFTTSTEYWRRRYDCGFGSGSGSRDRLATFKADFLNRFVAEHDVSTVLELGCGDGRQLALATYPDYTGLDIAPDALARCRRRFGDDPTRSFHGYDPATFDATAWRRELVLSLDVIYHLVEDDVYEMHLRHAFDAAERFVVLYSSDHESGAHVPHVRHRAFSAWVAAHRPEWERTGVVRNPYPWSPDDPATTWSDFHVFARRDGA